jgi:putative spermidine/putrescine transport system permease protein
MARAVPWLQTTLLVAIFLPMTASVIVKAFGWTILFRSNGLVNQLLMLVGLVTEPLPLLFSQAGLFVGTTSILLPFMVLPIYSVLRLVPAEVEDAAASLGATPAYRFLHVLLPLARPGIVTGCAFVFSMTVSAYVIPTVLTGASYKVMSRVIAASYLVVRDAPLGSTVSVLLLLIAGSGVVLAGLFARTAPRVR